MRFKDSPELFGGGVGGSSIGEMECEWCGYIYNKGNDDEDGDIIDHRADSYLFTDFAGKCICECCFEKIEYEIYLRSTEIIKWLKEIYEKRKSKAIEKLNNLDKLK